MPNLRLTIDTAALAANWRTYAHASGAAACGAAVKADGYGLGAREVSAAFVRAGCRELFVAHWEEAAALGPQPDGVRVAVLHGVLPGEMATALASPAVPVLNTPAQVAAWRETGRRCDVMVDTGMNRLGLTPADALSGLLDGLNIDGLHSHLACADGPGDPANPAQCAAFRRVAAAVPARRRSLANSAGVGLGAEYCLDLTRPGLGLYGGNTGAAPRAAAVASIAARVVQLRDVPAGGAVGYGGTWTAPRDSRIAVLSAGYADGLPRAAAAGFAVMAEGIACPLAGRISMDLCAADVTGTAVAEGDWLAIAFDLAAASAAAGISQYELLTGLGHRYERMYT